MDWKKFALISQFGTFNSSQKEASMTTSKATVKQQVSGFYRHQVGSLMVTALYDGFINLSPSLFHGLGEEEKRDLINQKFQRQTADGVPTAVTTYLIDDGADLILLNTGGAKCVGSTMGGLLESMEAAGYSAEEVSAVLLTHLHFDHVCGLTGPEGRPVFAKATVYASEDECRFWLDPQIALGAPEASRPFFEMAAKAVAPYLDQGAFIRFQDGQEVRPGIKAMLTPGHTPGHSSFLVSSGSEQLLLWGDIVHSHALQFIHPQVSNDFDSDQNQAAATRRSLFKKIIEEGWLVGGDHLPFPGLGHLTESGQSYGWVPIEFDRALQRG